MKRSTLLMVLGIFGLMVCLFVSDVSARRYWRHPSRATTLSVGYFNPKDAKSGALFEVNLSGAVDEAVDIGLSFDLFHRRYQRDSEIATVVSEGGLVERQIQRDLDFSTTALPFMGTITIKLGADMAFGYFLSGGLGYAFLWNKESNYVKNVSQRRFYHGISWKFGGGALYQLGSRSFLVAQVFYNDAHLKRDKGTTDNGLPIWTEVNLSGFTFSLGIRIER